MLRNGPLRTTARTRDIHLSTALHQRRWGNITESSMQGAKWHSKRSRMTYRIDSKRAPFDGSDAIIRYREIEKAAVDNAERALPRVGVHGHDVRRCALKTKRGMLHESYNDFGRDCGCGGRVVHASDGLRWRGAVMERMVGMSAAAPAAPRCLKCGANR